MRAWLKGLEVDSDQDPSNEVSVDHSHPGPSRIRSAYVLTAMALVIYTVDKGSIRVIYLGAEPPEHMRLGYGSE